MEEITVTGSQLGGTDSLSEPVFQLNNDEWRRGRESTLGRALESLPGVQADTFGGGASRPVIRGQSGPRVPILSSGSALMDASDVSPDHAVTIEPFLVEGIEVLRGPDALRFGAAAATGVVNVMDQKIPEEVPPEGFLGDIELRGGAQYHEDAAAARVSAGAGNWAVRLEGLRRTADDYRVPDWEHKRLDGSWTRSTSGSAAISWVGDDGYLGVAYSSTRSKYGLPGHDHAHHDCHPHGLHLHCGSHDHAEGHGHHEPSTDVHPEHPEPPWVNLRSHRYDLRGAWYDPLPGVATVRVAGAMTDYRHHEIDDGSIASTFRNRGYDARLEVEHTPLGGWEGVLGVESARSRFGSSGVESFLPEAITTRTSLFAVEKYKLSDWQFAFGARQDWSSVRPTQDSSSSHYAATSLSASAHWTVAPSYVLGLTLARTQRAPNSQELHAQGVHLATNTYELGDPNLQKETTKQVELSFRKIEGDTRFDLSVYTSRVNNYIYAQALDQHDGFSLVRYAQAEAEFHGVEGRVDHAFNRHFSAGAFGDMVRGRLSSGGGDLPRMPAARLGLRAQATVRNWSGDIELYRVLRQTHVAPHEQETGGYTALNAMISYDGRVGGHPYTVYIQGSNLLNSKMLNHASFLAHQAPLPGRQVMLGVRLELN